MKRFRIAVPSSVIFEIAAKDKTSAFKTVRKLEAVECGLSNKDGILADGATVEIGKVGFENITEVIKQ